MNYWITPQRTTQMLTHRKEAGALGTALLTALELSQELAVGCIVSLDGSKHTITDDSAYVCFIVAKNATHYDLTGEDS